MLTARFVAAGKGATMTNRHGAQSQNLVLGALPASELSLLLPQLKSVTLNQGTVLQEIGEPIQYVYFPISGMISFLVIMDDGKGVETAAVGKEGALGLNCGFGIFQDHTRWTVEIAGAGLRIPGNLFQRLSRESERLRDLIVRYSALRLAQTQQSVACNALHGAEERLARCLLNTSDTIDSNVVPLTHEFLSQVLGVRRTTVTTIASNLMSAGVIRYQRGRIEIRDREHLKDCACECYEVIRHLRAQVFAKCKR